MSAESCKPLVARVFKFLAIIIAFASLIIAGHSYANPLRGAVTVFKAIQELRSAGKGMEVFKTLRESQESTQSLIHFADGLVMSSDKDISILIQGAAQSDASVPEISMWGNELVYGIYGITKDQQVSSLARILRGIPDETATIGRLADTLLGLKEQDIWVPRTHRWSLPDYTAHRSAKIDLCKYRQFVSNMCELSNFLDTIDETLDSPRPDITARLAYYKKQIREQSNFIDSSMSFAGCAINTDICDCADMLGTVMDKRCD